MSIVEIDSRYGITLTNEVRRHLRVKKGQRVFVVPRGDSFIVVPVTENTDNELDRLIGDIEFNREARKRAEKFLLTQAV